MKSFFATILFTILWSITFGQDNVPLLYNQVPLSVNPSFAGTGCSPRLQTYFQRTYLSHNDNISYNTQLLTFDMPVYKKGNSKIGVGYRFNRDVACTTKFRQVRNLVSVSYRKSINQSIKKPQYLNIGLETGIFKTDLNLGDLRWPSQIGPNGYDPSLPGEDIDISSLNLDLNVGISWLGYLTEKIKINTGFAINHLNQPNISTILNSDVQIPLNWVSHTTLDIAATDQWHILPSAYYIKQGTHDFYIFGSNFGYRFSEKWYSEIGYSYVKNLQNMVNLKCQFQRWNVGGAYAFGNNSIFHKMEVTLGFAFGNYQCQ